MMSLTPSWESLKTNYALKICYFCCRCFRAGSTDLTLTLWHLTAYVIERVEERKKGTTKIDQNVKISNDASGLLIVKISQSKTGALIGRSIKES